MCSVRLGNTFLIIVKMMVMKSQVLYGSKVGMMGWDLEITIQQADEHFIDDVRKDLKYLICHLSLEN